MCSLDEFGGFEFFNNGGITEYYKPFSEMQKAVEFCDKMKKTDRFTRWMRGPCEFDGIQVFYTGEKI